MIETANITISRIQSILVSRSPKHTNQVMCALVEAAALLLVVPLKFIIMAITLLCFTMNLMDGSSDQTNRRLRELWESIQVSADAGLKMCRKKLVWTYHLMRGT